MTSFAEMKQFAVENGTWEESNEEQKEESHEIIVQFESPLPQARSETARIFVKNIEMISTLKFEKGLNDKDIAKRLSIDAPRFK